MAAQITMTPEELYTAAKTILQDKEDIMSELNAVNSKVDGISARWEGAAKSAFIDQFKELYNDLSKQVPQILEGVSQMLEGAAKALEETDASIASAMR